MTKTEHTQGADLDLSVQHWMTRWAEATPAVAELARLPQTERVAAGYGHTLWEIGQQPDTWLDTAARAAERIDTLAELLDGNGAVLVTGSGSSQFAGDCLAPALQASLAVNVRAAGCGQLLVDRRAVFPASKASLLISLARSGDSPESCAVVDAVLEAEPACRHLIVTCNPEGGLARRYADRGKVHCLVLDPSTCDQSLVMTSSFTNMVIAGLSLTLKDNREGYLRTVAALSEVARLQLLDQTQVLAEVARRDFGSVLFLGDGCRYGAAEESALKMLEITDGCISTRADSFLGLRHGPICAIRPNTLVVAFLASNPLARAYQMDLLAELRAKRLGVCRVIVGEAVPGGLAGDGDVAISRLSRPGVNDSNAPVLDVLVGQLLAFFRSVHDGFRPDSPSVSGVVRRVVSGFRIHKQ
jgi:tagatose-6-phosphate ketose/aldose isomerase